MTDENEEIIDVKEEEAVEDVVEEVASDEAEPQQQEEEEREESELEMQLAQIENLARIDPTILESEEYKKLDSAVNQAKQETTKEEEEEVEEDEVDDSPKSKKKEEDGDKLGISKRRKNAKKDIPVDEQTASFIKKHYAIDKTDKFFNSVDKWRQDSQDLSEVNDSHQELLEGLKELPQAIKNSITAFSNGNDYQAAFVESGGRLDFSQNFEDHSEQGVVRHYFSEKAKTLESKYDDGDIDEDDYKERISDLYDSSERLYSMDKERFDSQRADLIAKQEVKQKALKESVSRSVDNLRDTFDLSKADLQRVRQRLVNNDTDDLFYDKDGAFREDAAKRIALALYGEKVYDELLSQAENKGKSKATEEHVLRANKTPKRNNKGQQAPQNKKASDAVQHLAPAFQNDVYS